MAIWAHGYLEPHELSCCVLCETEIEMCWRHIRPLLLSYEWIETSWTQRNKWVILMDDPRNLISRARVYPRLGVVELLFERFHHFSPAIFGRSDFVVIADFDHFWRELSALV